MTILIDNFSISVEEWLPVVDPFSFAVDVVDQIHGITTSGTYFLHDGQIVSTSHSGIADGYRFCYDTPPTISGAISLTIHAENNNSDTKEEDYYLLYGYNVKFNELIDWGPKREVVTTVDAKNLAFCPNTKTDAFYFETADLHSYDLGASIQAIESVDLNATIYPQNTFFFYERTYTIKISGIQDFAGNKMSDFNFSFTIENK
jgi:hypothetical protein